MVYGISWNHRSDQEMAKGNVDFATYGIKHICFWRRMDPKQFKLAGKKPTKATMGQPQNDPAWEACNGQFGDGSLKPDGSAKVGDPQNVLCCEFYEAWADPNPETTMSRMRCVTGTGDGNVLLWRNVSTGDDCTMQADHWAPSNISHLTSYLVPPTSYLLPPASYLLPLTSYLLPPTSCLLPPTSCLLPLTSYPLPLTGDQEAAVQGRQGQDQQVALSTQKELLRGARAQQA